LNSLANFKKARKKVKEDISVNRQVISTMETGRTTIRMDMVSCFLEKIKTKDSS